MQRPAAMSTSIEPRDGIEQIREILVGALQRDIERKLARIESHMTARLNELQQETRRRMDVIEAHLRKETDALSSRTAGELVEMKDALRALTRDHRETTSAVEQRVAKLEETVARAQHELRGQILDQAKAFMDELQQIRQELADTLERELGELEPIGAEDRGPRESGQAGESPTP